MDDLLIRNGDVVDGTGAPARPANVVVRGDRIVAIEPGYDGLARRVVEARDHVVAPGFIDIKTHSDFALPSTRAPKAECIRGSPPNSSAAAALRPRRSRPAASPSSRITSPRWLPAWLSARPASRRISSPSPLRQSTWQ